MMHVKQIRDIVDAGRNGEAHDALDQLLALGPNNLEALKLRARLHEFEGRFGDESKVWDRILSVDAENQDATQYLLRRQLEDREHFYFTDDLPGGGRKFMAYPSNLVNTSALGLLGCIAFLLATRLSGRFPILAEPTILLAMFGGLVLLPWITIVVAYLSSIKSVSVSGEGVTIATRLKQFVYDWNDLEKICLAHGLHANGQARLSLVFMSKDQSAQSIEIDLNHASTAIRARSYLVREISRSFAEPEYAHRDSLGLESRKVSIF